MHERESEQSSESHDGPGKDPVQQESQRPREIGGPSGPEPTRYGDWEKNGRCSDF